MYDANDTTYFSILYHGRLLDVAFLPFAKATEIFGTETRLI